MVSVNEESAIAENFLAELAEAAYGVARAAPGAGSA